MALVFVVGCAGSIKVGPETPLVARGFDPYLSKRAVVLAFNAPDYERSLGNFFAASLHRELLAAGPFAQVAFHPEADPHGLQATPSATLAKASSLGAELGFAIAVTGTVEQFVYGRTADSTLVVSVWFLDTVTGEVVHAERLTARGKVGRMPPVWEPGLSSGPERHEMIDKVAREVARRIIRRWDLRQEQPE